MALFGKMNTQRAKLTATEVLNMREAYANGLATQGQLAREYQVSLNTVGKIVRGESWQGLAKLPPTKRESDASAQRVMELVAAAERAEKENATDPFARLQAEAERLTRADRMIDELTQDNPPAELSDKREV